VLALVVVQPDHLNQAAIAAISDETSYGCRLRASGKYQSDVGRCRCRNPNIRIYLVEWRNWSTLLDIRADALQAAFLPLHHRDP